MPPERNAGKLNKKNCIIILSLAVLTGMTMAQASIPGDLGVPACISDITFSPSNETSMAIIEVHLQIPRANLQFVKTDTSYYARFVAFLALFSDKQLVAKMNRADSVEVGSYFETHTSDFVRPQPYILDEIPRGDYILRIELTDRESKAKFVRTDNITAPSFDTERNVEFSSVVAMLDGEYWDANAYPEKDSFFFKFGVSVPKGIAGEVIEWIEDDYGVFSAETVSITNPGYHEIGGILAIPNDAVEFVFFAEFYSDGKKIAGTEKRVRLSSGRHLHTASSLEEAIAQLELLGDGSEIEELEDALEEDIDAVDSLINLFWRERDPTPGTEINEIKDEFYRRVAEANRRFGPYSPGWSTDFGEVFIVYGEPDEIDRHPFDSGFRAYEIWYYFNPRRSFYFEDRIGDGTYELVYRE